MINDVGKTTAIIRLDDYVLNLFNATVTDNMVGGIEIYGEDGKTKRYQMSINSDSLNGRCLMFTRSFPGNTIDHVMRPVVYLPESIQAEGQGATCIPLYECICPSVVKFISGNYQLTWWTNTDAMPSKDGLSRYVFDYSKVHKFKTSELGDVESTSSSCKVFCTAPVQWEKLKFVKYDDAPYDTPVIRSVSILTAISGEGFIVDFSTGTGSGMKIHSHLNTMDGGFAAAVFMPSAIPRQMSWI